MHTEIKSVLNESGNIVLSEELASKMREYYPLEMGKYFVFEGIENPVRCVVVRRNVERE